MAVAAVVGIGAGLALLHFRSDNGRAVAESFARAWHRGDYSAMYALVDPTQRRSLPRPAFNAAYRRAATTATATRVATGRLRQAGDDWILPVRVRTRAFGVVAGTVRLSTTTGEQRWVHWSPTLTFPGLTAGATLSRHTRPPRRAPLLARDGRPLTDADGLPTQLGTATGFTGDLGRAKGAQRRALVAAGFPADTAVGVSGLQQALDDRLRGLPGGTLLAAGRVLARSTPVPAAPIRTSLDPRIQRAAQDALGGQFGGVAALEPGTGEVLALAGIAQDGAQPPGSTFKIMTVTAALESGLVTLRSKFPVKTGADVGGRFLANAHDEACGGDLTESFSKSCNSVFAPLGVKLGARRLVDVAQRFGFNQPPAIPGAKPDVIPSAGDMTDPAEVGASAIGQGRVLATALGMARVGSVIANGGLRPRLTLLHGERPRLVRATSPKVAGLVRQLMLSVVNGEGATGNSAAISGQKVAGKTGTAELGGNQPNDAWFVAFAPAPAPKLVVGVLVVNGGFGGETAAPIARQVLLAGLGGG
ncbi:MAG: penicillin-binding transpeptidase domain-containing protein [Solirubrobacteraceae bacterium]